MLVIQELLFDRTRQSFVEERFSRCPEGMRLHDVGSWLRQVYGPAVDAAWTTTTDGDNVLVGWVFAVPAGWRSASADSNELVAIPMLSDTHGQPAASVLLECARRGGMVCAGRRVDGAQEVLCVRRKRGRRRADRPAADRPRLFPAVRAAHDGAVTRVAGVAPPGV